MTDTVHTWARSRLALAPLVALATCTALLSACGGGDGGGRTQVIDTQAGDADAPACVSCAPGIVTGVAAIGRPLAHARVNIYADTGLVTSASTDSAGQFRIDLSSPGPRPQKALLVELITQVAGEPLVLYGVMSAEEVQAGRRALNLTPLSTLITADVLGAAPRTLLARGAIDWPRVTRRALRDAETRVQSLVQPVLDASAVPAGIDLRSTVFTADGTGLDAALDLIQIEPAQGGWTVAWKAGANAGQTRVYDPAAPSPGVLPALSGPVGNWQLTLTQTTADLNALLGSLTNLFAQGVPTAGALAPYLAADFLHSGLDATTYIQRVLQRQDPLDEGGYSLVGARWGDVLVLEHASATEARVRFKVQARDALGTRSVSMRLVKDGTGWRLRGNGDKASIQVRHALVLGPTNATAQVLQGKFGAACADDVRGLLSGTWCSAPGGQAGLPAGGTLDFGDPLETAFGGLGIFQSTGTLAAQRQAAAQHSRVVGTPSSATRHYLVFEVDAREIAPSVATVRVRGGALPSGGIDLVAPGYTVNGPAFEHWTLAIDEGTGWAGLPWGWCAQAIEPTDCTVAWQGMRGGASLVFDLLDGQGQLIASQTVTLPPEPLASGAATGVAARLAFARFDLASAPASQPQFAPLMGNTGQALLIDWPWLGTSGTKALQADLSLQRTDLVATGGTETIRRRTFLDPAATGAHLTWTLPAKADWGAQWLQGRLTATDELGVQRIHFVAPSNPY